MTFTSVKRSVDYMITFQMALKKSCQASGIADHITSTGHKIRRDHFEIRIFLDAPNNTHTIYAPSLHVKRMNTNTFFLVVIAVSFDSNSRGTNYDISPCAQCFYSKEVVVLWALLLTKCISTQTALSEFRDQRVKGIMWTSGAKDFR